MKKPKKPVTAKDEEPVSGHSPRQWCDCPDCKSVWWSTVTFTNPVAVKTDSERITDLVGEVWALKARQTLTIIAVGILVVVVGIMGVI